MTKQEIDMEVDKWYNVCMGKYGLINSRKIVCRLKSKIKNENERRKAIK